MAVFLTLLSGLGWVLVYEECIVNESDRKETGRGTALLYKTIQELFRYRIDIRQNRAIGKKKF